MKQIEMSTELLEEIFTERENIKSSWLFSLITYSSESSSSIYLGGKKKRKTGKKKKIAPNEFNLDSDSEQENADRPETSEQNKGKTGGILPDVWKEYRKFDEVILWKKLDKKEVPEPKWGLDKNFDEANDAIEWIKAGIEKYHKEIKRELKMPELGLSITPTGYVSTNNIIVIRVHCSIQID